MLGTIVNTACIVAGTLIGTLFKKGLGEKYTKTLFNAMGLASIALGANSFVANMPKSEFPVLFILSLAIGGLAGTAMDLDGRVKRLLAKKGGESPVLSALQGDNTFLYTNSTLDLVTSTVFATTYGIGMILAAPILFCWQGSIWLAATLASSSPIFQGTLVNELAIVGGVLIISSGLSILDIKDCKTLNYIPALLVPILWFLVKGLF